MKKCSFEVLGKQKNLCKYPQRTYYDQNKKYDVFHNYKFNLFLPIQKSHLRFSRKL